MANKTHKRRLGAGAWGRGGAPVGVAALLLEVGLAVKVREELAREDRGRRDQPRGEVVARLRQQLEQQLRVQVLPGKGVEEGSEPCADGALCSQRARFTRGCAGARLPRAHDEAPARALVDGVGARRAAERDGYALVRVQALPRSGRGVRLRLACTPAPFSQNVSVSVSMSVCARVCVCVRVRERERMKEEEECVRLCVHERVCVRERERGPAAPPRPQSPALAARCAAAAPRSPSRPPSRARLAARRAGRTSGGRGTR
jgi:hypothetical protein